MKADRCCRFAIAVLDVFTPALQVGEQPASMMRRRWCTTGRWTDLSSQLQRCHRGGAVGVPLEIRRDGGAGAETRGHDLFLVAVDDGVQSMRRPQLKAAATEDDGTLPTLALVVDWLQIK